MSLEELKNDQDAIEAWFEIVKTNDVSEIENYANNLLAEGEKLEDLIKLKNNSGQNALMIASKERKVKSFEWLIENINIDMDNTNDDYYNFFKETKEENKIEIIAIALKTIIEHKFYLLFSSSRAEEDINKDIELLKNDKSRTGVYKYYSKFLTILIDHNESLLNMFTNKEIIDESQKQEVANRLLPVTRESFDKMCDKIVQKLKNIHNNNPSTNPTLSTTTVKTPEEIVEEFYSNRYDTAKFQKKEDSNLSNFLITVPSITLPVAAGVGLYKLLPKYFRVFQHKTKLLAATIGGTVLTFVASFSMAGSLAVKYEYNKYAKRVTNEIKETRKDLTSDQLDLIKSEIKKRAGEESGHYYNAK